MIKNKDFVERINILIDKAGLNNNQLSKAIGIHPTSINNYRSGITFPEPLRLDKLASFFDVRKEWLKTGDGDKYLNQDSDNNYLNFTGQREEIIVNKEIDEDYIDEDYIVLSEKRNEELQNDLNEAMKEVIALNRENRKLKEELEALKEKNKDHSEGSQETT